MGTYGDYYPSGLGWWAVKQVPDDIKARYPYYVHGGEMWSGDYAARCGQVFTCENKRTKKLEQVAVNWHGTPDGGALCNAQYDPTCLGVGTVGSLLQYPEAEVRARFPAAGSKGLKMAPVGLGLLIYTKCLVDARMFYCPAANNQRFHPSSYDRGQVGNWAQGDYKDPHNSCELCKHPRYDPAECNDYWKNVTGAWNSTGNGQPFKSWGADSVDDTLTSWYKAGGIDGDTLVHGEWGRRASISANTGFAVYGQYMYRNQPIGVTYASNHQSWDGKNVWGYYDCVNPFTVCFTSPAVTTTPGCPAFKTPRGLGSRALASDSWEKSTVVARPGFGAQAHRDGYQVLYGNYQTKWFPDRGGNLMYWSGRNGLLSPPPGATAWYTPGLGTTVTLWMAGQKERQGSPVNWSLHGLYASLDPLVWHQLDMAVDMDLNANVDLYDQRNGEPDPPAPYSPKKPW
jgi:hypothetical protein